jgi:hypothetical protein|mmetsp:Transcript_11539/g.18393  ORF Transcript_11539/g.18393 Transcript_11539/m.18393 type:complete len:470 (-) Transcript_11539:606-2015(-)
MNGEINEFNFNLSITKHSPYIMGILSPSNIVFASLENFKILKKIKTEKESFLNGNFRKKDSKIFATSSRNGDISLFYLSSMKALRNFLCLGKVIYSTSFSDNGLNLISGGEEGVLKLWDIGEQKHLQEFQSGGDVIKKVSYFPNHNWIIGSSSYDGKIRIFDLRCKKKIINYKFGFPVESFMFLPDQRVLIAIGGNSIKFWDMRNNSILFKKKESSPILNLSSPNKNSIMYSTLGRTIKYTRTSDFRFFHIGRYKKRISDVEFLNHGFLVSFTSGKILIKKKKILNFLKTNDYKSELCTTRIFKRNTKFLGDKFLPPLKIFHQKTPKNTIDWILKNFKDKLAKSSFLTNKIMNDLIYIKNENNQQKYYYNLKKGNLTISKHFLSWKNIENVFFDYEEKKILCRYKSASSFNTFNEINFFFRDFFIPKHFDNASNYVVQKCKFLLLSSKILKQIDFLFRKLLGNSILILS